MNVPFIDLKAQFAKLEPQIVAAVTTVMKNTNFILGREVEEFEKAFADYIGVPHAIGVASGLDAIRLILKALKVGSGDEVITAANTFIATTLAVDGVGACPILVDCHPESYNLDPARLEAAITPRTKAIIPVHLYGQSADMKPIMDLARKHGLYVLEDASQAHGARYRGQRVGTFGIASAFSLYPGKNLGAYGDAGIAVALDAGVADTLRGLRNYGSKVKYYHDFRGENSRLDTLQAAILKVKLSVLEEGNIARRKAAGLYAERLAGVGDLVLPKVMDYAEPVWHLFVIRTRQRDALMKHLQEKGVGCIIHYPVPIHLQKAYAGAGWTKGQFPITESYAEQILSLPMFPEITTEQIDYVTKQIRNFFGA